MSRTIEAETPAPPAWVQKAGQEAIWAWNNWLSWRRNAAQATTAQYRRTLIAQANRASGK